MKNFLSKYWKRILITITGIFIFLDIINKVAIPNILVSEFAKYGPDVKSSGISIQPSEIMQEAKASAPMSGDMFNLIIVFIVGLVAAVIIGELASKKPSAAKKK